MSRGFVKEGDQEEPPMIPPRASLPPGTMNYVTPEGYDQLIQEKEGLVAERSSLNEENERETRRKKAEIDGKLALLNERINSARVLDIADQPKEEVRFGATVTYQMGSKGPRTTLKIVGVDEANIKKKKVGFVAPIARAMIGHQVGDEVAFSLGGEERKLKINAIKYE